MLRNHKRSLNHNGYQKQIYKLLATSFKYRGYLDNKNFTLPGEPYYCEIVLIGDQYQIHKMNFQKGLFFEKKGKTRTIPRNLYILFSTTFNCTIPGILLSETVLSGDPLYLYLCIKLTFSLMFNDTCIQNLHLNAID